MLGRTFPLMVMVAASLGVPTMHAETVKLVGDGLVVEVETTTGRWALEDTRSGVRWPSQGTASPGSAQAFADGFARHEVGTDAAGRPVRLQLTAATGMQVAFALVNEGRSLELAYAGEGLGDLRVFGDALDLTDADGGYAVLPTREGLLIRADSGREFQRTFGTSDYEGCHMNMVGLVKQGSALVLDWDDAYVFPELRSALVQEGGIKQRITTSVVLRRSARAIRITPLGKGDWNTVAAGYRRLAAAKGFAITLAEKTRREPHAGLLPGAANVKLWTCLARRMNEDSTAEESVKVRWTFDQAARIAEHLRHDLGIGECLFTIGGWTEGGYDCRHPDALPANPECGGNEALADAVKRIQALGYVAAFHDNYQDMYADAKSWNPDYIEKDSKGNLLKGGRWLGGRAYMVCAPKQLELAQRPQNLPEIKRLFDPWCYFIDTTFAVGPRECHDPNHPLDRNSDILWKSRLSAYSREVFGLFGSECGREWALPHSDWFEGLVGVSGRYFHNLDPETLGATVIPFWEMVYHDCIVAHGKYGYAAEQAAEYVVHHALSARTLHYHSVPDGLYWETATEVSQPVPWQPAVAEFKPVGPREFDITYEWAIEAPMPHDWRVFVHFMEGEKILFQNDHLPNPGTSTWQAGQKVRLGPFRVAVPETVKAPSVKVCIGLFGPGAGDRVRLANADSQRRIQLGELKLTPELVFTPGGAAPAVDRSCYTRCDQGWGEGQHPMDVFLKNTQEVLGPLNAATFHQRLERFEFLNADGNLRRAVYGEGAAQVVVTANFGPEPGRVVSALGGEVVLPQWGLLVEAPQFVAFHATRWAGRDYPEGVLFTIRAEDGKPLATARKLRLFHGFGNPELVWQGRNLRVEREATVSLD